MCSLHTDKRNDIHCFASLPWRSRNFRKLHFGVKNMQDERNRLQYLYNTVTKDKAKLSKLCKMKPSTFRRNFGILEKGGVLERKAGSGRASKLTTDDRRRIARLAQFHPLQSAEYVNRKQEDRSGKQISTRTVQRSLKKSGIFKQLPIPVPAITPLQEQKRLQFANEWKDFDFLNVFMTDECIFQLYRNKIKVWTSRRCPKPVKKIPKFSPKIMVWGALSFKGFYLKIVDGNGNIDSRKYCGLIGEFIPYASALFIDGWIMEQDGATPHTSRFTQSFLADNFVQLLQWPPNSPDLTPIENVWNILKKFVEKENPRNLAELREKIILSQHEISSTIRVKLMGSIQERLRRCVEAHGKLI